VAPSSGIQAGGAADSDEWGARALESRPLHRCVQADSRVTRSVRGASTGATRGFGRGHARLTAGRSTRLAPQRIASHRGAREVRELEWCAPDSVLVAEVIEQRLAQRSHSGCGWGGGRGPSPVGRPASAKYVDRSGAGDGHRTPRFVKSRSMVEGVSDRGSRRSSRGGGESGLGQATGGHKPHAGW
jgi:hypothetical protein